MVRRQVVVEGRVVEELGGTPLGHVGLLVGQVLDIASHALMRVRGLTAQRDYVCLCVPTPPAPVTDETDPTGGCDKGCVGVAVLSELEDWWLLEHARQVTRVLPGGLEVIGLFVTTPPDAAKGLYPRLRLLLEQLRLVCSASQYVEDAESALLDPPHTSRIVLQVCPTTNKCVVKTVDVGDKRSALLPSEVKFQEHSSRWHTLRCMLALRELLLCPVLRRSEVAVLTQLKSALSPYLSVLVRGEVVWGGEVVDRSGPVVPQTSGRQKGATSSVGVDSVDLYLKQGACVGECSVERSPSLRVGGCLVSVAVVPPRATWADAERAIKVDVLRSLLARVELLSQEIGRQGQKEDPVMKAEEPVQLGFPRRVTVTADSTPFPLSDYCFEDESDKECVQRLGELLSVADLSSLEVTSVEGRAALGGGDHLEEEGHGGTLPTPSPSAGKGGGHLLGITGAILTAGVALVVWWWTQSRGPV